MKMLKQFEDLCRNVVEDLKGRWDFYRHSAYLKKMGLTEEAYKKQTDPLVNQRADRLEYFYHGYDHIHIFTRADERPFTNYDTWIDAYAEMNLWCTANCRGLWREDIHRVRKQMGFIQVGKRMDWAETSEYIIDEIGGGDALIYAFEDSKDYTMFILRWL